MKRLYPLNEGGLNKIVNCIHLLGYTDSTEKITDMLTELRKEYNHVYNQKRISNVYHFNLDDSYEMQRYVKNHFNFSYRYFSDREHVNKTINQLTEIADRFYSQPKTLVELKGALFDSLLCMDVRIRDSLYPIVDFRMMYIASMIRICGNGMEDEEKELMSIQFDDDVTSDNIVVYKSERNFNKFISAIVYVVSKKPVEDKVFALNAFIKYLASLDETTCSDFMYHLVNHPDFEFRLGGDSAFVLETFDMHSHLFTNTIVEKFIGRIFNLKNILKIRPEVTFYNSERLKDANRKSIQEMISKYECEIDKSYNI